MKIAELNGKLEAVLKDNSQLCLKLERNEEETRAMERSLVREKEDIAHRFDDLRRELLRVSEKLKYS
ncbi:unnamed protein product [Sphagnum balticum]